MRIDSITKAQRSQRGGSLFCRYGLESGLKKNWQNIFIVLEFSIISHAHMRVGASRCMSVRVYVQVHVQFHVRDHTLIHSQVRASPCKSARARTSPCDHLI